MAVLGFYLAQTGSPRFYISKWDMPLFQLNNQNKKQAGWVWRVTAAFCNTCLSRRKWKSLLKGRRYTSNPSGQVLQLDNIPDGKDATSFSVVHMTLSLSHYKNKHKNKICECTLYFQVVWIYCHKKTLLYKVICTTQSS